MKSAVLFALTVASTDAFLSSSSSSTSSALAAAKAKAVAKKVVPKKVVAKKVVSKKPVPVSFESDFGAMLPLGFWDPLGLVKDADQAKFDRLRLTEIKHGRIAMLAVVGNLITEAGIRLPGNVDLSGLKFADVPSGYAAIETIPYAGNLQILAFIGALEVLVMRDFVGGEFPGDLRNNYFDLGWDTFDEATKLRKRTIELNQGRAAMMGILALMVHEQLGVSIIPSVADSSYSF